MPKVRDVIAIAEELSGRSDLKSAGESSEEVKLLLRCFNLVENEIALDYLPLRIRETFSAGKEIPFSAFSHAPVSVKGVKDFAGGEVGFELLFDRVVLSRACECEIDYAFAPAEKTMDDDSDFSGPVSARLMAYGVASEFARARGLFAEAVSFDKRYRDALSSAGAPRRALRMRGRRWA